MLPPIQLTGHHIEITTILRDYVTNKFKHLAKHADRITSIHVVLDVIKLRQLAEARLHIPNAEIYAKAESENMYKTIDLLIAKLVRQLEKFRGRNIDFRKQ